MRTKALLLTAAVIAAGVATSMAQSVYSVNAVGYVNVTLKDGYNLLGNPLKATNNNHINAVLPNVPDFTGLLKWDNASQQFSAAETFFDGQWFDGNTQPSQTRIAPGEGIFVQNTSGGEVTITFVGEVEQGSLTNVMAPNYGFYASQVPQAGTLPSLAFPGADFMTFNSWNPMSQSFNAAYTYFDGQWFDPNTQPNAPTVGVAEGFLISNPDAVPINWTRNFSVNNN